MTLKQRFGRALARRRRQHGWTQLELAARIEPELSVGELIDIERGRIDVSLDTAECVAKPLNWAVLSDDQTEQELAALRLRYASAQQLLRFQLNVQSALATLSQVFLEADAMSEDGTARRPSSPSDRLDSPPDQSQPDDAVARLRQRPGPSSRRKRRDP